MINLDDDEADIVEKMIEFLYTAQYTRESDTEVHEEAGIEIKDLPGTHAVDSHSMVQSVKLYIMGDKYDLSALKTFAKNDFESLTTNELWCLDPFIKSLELIYTQLPESDTALKEVAMKCISAASRVDELLDCAEFKVLSQEVGQVCFDLMKAHRRFAKEQEEINRRKTPVFTSGNEDKALNCERCRSVQTFVLVNEYEGFGG